MKACILDQSFSTLIFATNPADPILNTFRLLHEDGFGKRYEWIASIDAPTSQAVGNGKKKNKIILSPPLSQLSATLLQFTPSQAGLYPMSCSLDRSQPRPPCQNFGTSSSRLYCQLQQILSTPCTHRSVSSEFCFASI